MHDIYNKKDGHKDGVDKNGKDKWGRTFESEFGKKGIYSGRNGDPLVISEMDKHHRLNAANKLKLFTVYEEWQPLLDAKIQELETGIKL